MEGKSYCRLRWGTVNFVTVSSTRRQTISGYELFMVTDVNDPQYFYAFLR
jgi:hypothetical protein